MYARNDSSVGGYENVFVPAVGVLDGTMRDLSPTFSSVVAVGDPFFSSEPLVHCCSQLILW